MAAITNITSLANFRTYIRTVLGEPVIKVDIADDQLTLAINDTIQDFRRYNYGEGNYSEYMALNLLSGTNEYSFVGQDILGIYDIELSIGANGVETPFTPQSQIIGSDFMMYGGESMALVEYDLAMTFYENIKNKFNVLYRVDYIPMQEVLRVYPTPRQDSTALIYMYKKEEALNLYNNSLVKKLAVARSQVQWGRNLRKFGGMTLPDGSTLSFDAILSEGREDEEKHLQQMKDESEPASFFIG